LKKKQKTKRQRKTKKIRRNTRIQEHIQDIVRTRLQILKYEEIEMEVVRVHCGDDMGMHEEVEVVIEEVSI